MYVFESEQYLNHLTKQEEKARDIMVYLFNPVLKYVLANAKPMEFAKYGFNSCRQTAILGAAYLQYVLPDYCIVPYEGLFSEDLPNGNEQYIHAFILASKDDRCLLIDLSRTTKRLMFGECTSTLYPLIEDYKDMVLINKNPINLKQMIETDVEEYFTNMKPIMLLDMISTLIKEVQSMPKHEQNKFCDMVYAMFTQLRR